MTLAYRRSSGSGATVAVRGPTRTSMLVTVRAADTTDFGRGLGLQTRCDEYTEPFSSVS
jgi:hypothetical protein